MTLCRKGLQGLIILWVIFFLCGWKAPSKALLPEVKMQPKVELSAKWLWFQAPEISPNTTARYRFLLDIPEDTVRKAIFYAGFDDAGEFYLNEKKLSPIAFPQPDFQVKFRKYDLSKNLRPGKNLLAFEARNGVAKGGMILRGNIMLSSGRNINLFSDTKFKAAKASKQNKDFFKMSFNDSDWKNAMAFGDATTAPWNRVSDVFGIFTTPSEKAAYNKAYEALAILPSAIKKEKPADVKIIYRNNMAAFSINGKVHPPVTYLLSSDPWIPTIADQLIKLNRAGVNFFEYVTSTNRMFRSENKYDFSFIDRDVRRILSLAPNARLIIHLRFDLFSEWLKKHPEELIGYPTGKAYGLNDLTRRLAPSMASNKFREEMVKFTTAFVRYLQSQEWYNRVMAIRTSHGVFSEWHYYGMSSDMPDTGIAMTTYFRNWLKRKYGSNESLAQAWHKEGLTFDQVEVPGVSARLGEKRFLRNPNNFAEASVIDYYKCHSEVVAETLLMMAKAVKKVAPKLLVGAYYGYTFGFPYPAEGSTLELERVLSSPYIDFLSAPFCYANASRHVDGDSLPRTIPSSFHRHGKLHLYEADTRTHLTYPRIFGNAKNPHESAITLQRNFATAMVNGTGLQLLSFQKAWFNDPQIMTAIYDSLKAWKKLYKLRKVKPNSIAAVFDPSEFIIHDRPQAILVREGLGAHIGENTLHALNRSGFSYDLLSMQDYLKSTQKYKVTIFLNAFSPSSVIRKMLRQKIQQTKTNAIWIYAPGLVTTTAYSAEAMSELTGIKLDFESKKKPFLVKLANGTLTGPKYKGNVVYDSPRCFSNESKVQVIGSWQDSNQPAIVLKKSNNRTVTIFSAVPLVDPKVWRDLFQLCGLSPRSPLGLVYVGKDSACFIYTSRAGKWTVKLPKTTTELLNKPVKSKNNYNIELQSTGPQIWLFNSPKITP